MSMAIGKPIPDNAWQSDWIDNNYTFVEHVDLDHAPPQAVRVKKMIWNDNQQDFVTHYFIRVQCSSKAQCDDTAAWCQDQFGVPFYQGSWWKDPGDNRRIWLADSLATFWQLKWGDR